LPDEKKVDKKPETPYEVMRQILQGKEAKKEEKK